MGSIPLPALNVKTPDQPDLLQKYGQLQQLKLQAQQSQLQQQEAPLRMQALQQNAQAGQMDLQQKTLEQQDQQAFRAASQDPSFQGKTIGQIADALAASGHISPAGLIAAKKADTEHQEAIGKLDTTKLDNAKKSHDALQQVYNNVMDMPDDQLAANWPQIAQQVNSIPGGDKPPLNPQQPLTKQQLSQFGPMLSLGNTYLDQELARRQKTTELAQTQGKSDPKSPFYAPSKESVAMGTAPGADQIQSGEVKQAARKAGAESAARQPYELSLAAQKQALSQGDPKAAGQLMVDGDATLSELKARGATPDFIARSLFAAKQLSGGKYSAQEAEANFNIAKSQANTAFFGSAKSLTDKGGTLDQLAEAAKDIPGHQIPVFNTIADAEKAASGSGPIAKYASIMLGVSDDYSKVMGGGAGSDSSRSQALHLVPANASPEARAAAIQGIRGAVGSQINSRIGNNPIMRRMYGSQEAPAAADATGPATHVYNQATGKIEAIK